MNHFLFSIKGLWRKCRFEAVNLGISHIRKRKMMSFPKVSYFFHRNNLLKLIDF